MTQLIFQLPPKLRLTDLWRILHRSSVPVLLLHGVLPDRDARPFNSTGKFISPELLRDFLQRISRIFRIVSVKEFIDCLVEGRSLRNVMVLTFDDGYANTYTYALPLLREMGLPFSVFMTTGLIDSDRILWTDMLEFAVFTTVERILPKGVLTHDVGLATDSEKLAAIGLLKDILKQKRLEEASKQVGWICEKLHVESDAPELRNVGFLSSAQIKEMSDQGVIFGGHTVTHPILSRESTKRVRSEISECKRHLEAITGRPVAYFAYPNGRREDFNDMVKGELVRAGYAASFTSIHGLHHPGDDLFEIKRISVLNRWTYEEFETRASGILKALRR